MSVRLLIKKFVGFFLLSYLVFSSQAWSYQVQSRSACYRPPEVGYPLKMEMQVSLQKLNELGLVPDFVLFGFNSEPTNKFELNVYVKNRISETKDLVFKKQMTREEPVFNVSIDQIRSKAYSEVSLEIKISEKQSAIGFIVVNGASSEFVDLMTFYVPTKESGADLHEQYNEKLLLNNELNEEAVAIDQSSLLMANEAIQVEEKHFECDCANNKICEGMYAFKYEDTAPAGLPESQLVGFSGTVGALSMVSPYKDLLTETNIFPKAYIVRSVNVESVVISPKDSLEPEYEVSTDSVFSVWPSDDENLKPVGTTALVPNIGYGLGRLMLDDSLLVNTSATDGGPLTNGLMKVSVVGYLPSKGEYEHRAMLLKVEADALNPTSFDYNSRLESPLYMVAAGDHYMYYDEDNLCGQVDDKEVCVGDKLLRGTDEELEVFAMNPRAATITPVEMWAETMPLTPMIGGPSFLAKSKHRGGDFYSINLSDVRYSHDIFFGVEDRTTVASFGLSRGDLIKTVVGDRELRVLGANGKKVVLIDTENKTAVRVDIGSDKFYREGSCKSELCPGIQIANMKMLGQTMAGNYLFEIEEGDLVRRVAVERSFRFEASNRPQDQVCDREDKVCNADKVMALVNGQLSEVSVAAMSLVLGEYLVTVRDAEGHTQIIRTSGSDNDLRFVGNLSSCSDQTKCYNFSLGKDEEFKVKGVAKSFSGETEIVAINNEFFTVPSNLSFTNLNDEVKTYINGDSILNYQVDSPEPGVETFLVGFDNQPRLVPAVVGADSPQDILVVLEVSKDNLSFRTLRASELSLMNGECALDIICVGQDLGVNENIFISDIKLTGDYMINGLTDVVMNLNQLDFQVYEMGTEILYRASQDLMPRFVTPVGRANYLLPYSNEKSVIIVETEDTSELFVADNSNLIPAETCVHEYCEYWNNRSLGFQILNLNDDGMIVIEDAAEMGALGPGLNIEPNACVEVNGQTLCNGSRVYRKSQREDLSFDGIVVGSYQDGSRTKFLLSSQSGDTVGQLVQGVLSNTVVKAEGCSDMNVCAGDVIYSQGNIRVEYFGNYVQRDLEIFALLSSNEFEEFDGQFIGEGCLQDGINDLICVGEEYRVNYSDRFGGVMASVLIGFKEKANGQRKMIFVPTTGEYLGKMFEADPRDQDVFLDRIPTYCQLNPELSCSEEDKDVSADNVFYNELIEDLSSVYSQSQEPVMSRPH